MFCVVAVIAVMRPTVATAGDCDAVENAKLRARIELEHDRAQTWRYAWAIGFGAASIAQAAGTQLVDDRVQRDTLWVGAAKAGIGATSRLILPLRIPLPPPVDPDACADGVKVRAALDVARHNEKVGFWLDHIGGFLVNAAGAVVLTHYANWKAGAISFAMGYPVGLISTYTMPRWAMHATPIEHGAAIGVTVAF